MTDLSELDKAREQAIQEIVSVGGINGGVPPKTVDEFWYQVAVGMQVGIPEHGVLNMARQVFRWKPTRLFTRHSRNPRNRVSFKPRM